MQALESCVGEPDLSLKDKMIPIKIYLCLVKCALNPSIMEVHRSESLASPFYCVSKQIKHMIREVRHLIFSSGLHMKLYK